MKFERRIFLLYSALIIALIALFSLTVRHYLFSFTKEKIITAMENTAGQCSRQLEELTHSMEFITDYILSDSDTLAAMSTMVHIDDSTKSGFEFKETARTTIRLRLYNACILKNFYRVSYFDDRNDLITTEFELPLKENVDISSDIIPWLYTAKASFGKVVVGGVYRDPWVRDDKSVMVFGLGRAMPGKGYLEVQQKISMLDDIFTFRNHSLKAVVFDSNDTLLYSNTPDSPNLTSKRFLPYFEKLSSADPTFSSIDGENTVIVGDYSPKTGVKVFLIQNLETNSPELHLMNMAVALISLLIVLVSLTYIFLSARKLSHPIRELRRQIETTDLQNLGSDTRVETENDEIKAVSNAFSTLMKRLDEAIKKQNDMALLHLQAQLNSLQAQTNPHFLNNVLNVISCRGFADDDEEICNICDNLAALMQYSLNTKCHKATIREELENYGHYQYLLKSRYKEKLAFSTDVDAILLSQDVPRFLIQPIVENCIAHGYDAYPGTMRISLEGTVDGGWWYISVTDNGTGFSPASLALLKEKMETIRQKLFVRHENIELSSGEIGIVNTYARMLLFYGSEDSVCFTLENVREHGAKVTFGALFREEECE